MCCTALCSLFAAPRSCIAEGACIEQCTDALLLFSTSCSARVGWWATWWGGWSRCEWRRASRGRWTLRRPRRSPRGERPWKGMHQIY